MKLLIYMRFLLVLLLTIFILRFDAFTQNNENNGSMGVAAGIAIPVADFASTDFSKENAAAAIPGFSGLFFTNVAINNWWGISGLIIYNSNPLDENAYLENFKFQNPSNDYTFESNNYSLTSMMGGAYASLPQGDVLITLKGLIGYSVADLPETKSTASNGFEAIVRENNASVFTVGGGLDIAYLLTENISLNLNAEYIHAKPNFTAVSVETYFNSNLVDVSSSDIRQQFDVLSVSLGIGLLF